MILNTLEGFDSPVMEIIELQSERLILNCNETFFLMWEWISESSNNLNAFDNHEGPIRVLLNIGKKIITGSSDRTIKVWAPERTTEPEITFSGHEDEVICLI